MEPQDLTVDELAERFLDVLRDVLAHNPEIASAIGDSTSKFRAFADEMLSMVVGLVDNSPKLEKIWLYLSNRGWYPFAAMPDHLAILAGIEGLVEADERTGVDAYMADLVEGVLDDLANEVATKHPSRASLVREALAAHREGRFGLAIPVLLAQADGVAIEALQVSLYGKVRDRPRIADRIRPSPLLDFSFAPLREAGPLIMDTSERDALRESDPTFGALNRHGVMHGIDVSYGTRENSLRAFSILGCAVMIHWRESETSASRRVTSES